MVQTVKAFTGEVSDARKWIGRILVGVILGEAIWNLIVSVINNVFVPWLGDVVGQSSGVSPSFTQRPYDYPDLLVSVLEFCIAGIMAVILNYFFQRQRAGRAKAPTAPVESARVVPQLASAAKMTWDTSSAAAPVAKPNLVSPPAPVVVASATTPPFVSPGPVATPVAIAHPATPVVNSAAAKPLPPAPKADLPRLKKQKEVYYNIVGEPMPSDED